MSEAAGRRKLLLVGWDAADWKVISPLLDHGLMPYLAGVLERGVMGNLATLGPILSPMLWTSIATGKRAYKHGIHGFAEPDPHSGAVRPITNLSRSTKALWNILNQAGKTSLVVGCWSWPAPRPASSWSATTASTPTTCARRACSTSRRDRRPSTGSSASSPPADPASTRTAWCSAPACWT
jgi:predicted AlkP superfamily phosphohydrolase/phosphomutase